MIKPTTTAVTIVIAVMKTTTIISTITMIIIVITVTIIIVIVIVMMMLYYVLRNFQALFIPVFFRLFFSSTRFLRTLYWNSDDKRITKNPFHPFFFFTFSTNS